MGSIERRLDALEAAPRVMECVPETVVRPIAGIASVEQAPRKTVNARRKTLSEIRREAEAASVING